MAIAASGIAIGTLLSLFLARFLISQVKGISVYDTAAFVLAALLLGTVALLATAIPARRAARIQPNLALRAD
jgi:ABC-type antimicrobial peptide transport system permease subunit